MPAPFALGPFRLLAPIARGGMGAVWRGEHVEQGLPVAVKVMTSAASREARYRAAFAAEVRHMATLDHPAIALVFDHGEVGEAAARASDGWIAARSPYLVMEYASGGTLADADVRSWRALKAILASLLDALAHAHARGVVHRDLKPGNVLIGTPTDHRPGLKLTDFGIARATDRPVTTETPTELAGTLNYMAPEQILGRWRDDGPWTDLYALGGVAWRLATGKAPFHGLEGASLRRAHLLDDPPCFSPRFAVPEGFEAWLRRGLRKDVNARWQRAADAAWALGDLPDPPEGPGPEGPYVAQAPRLFVSEPHTLFHDPDLVATDLSELAGDAVQLVATGGAAPRPDTAPRDDAPPVSRTWRRPTGRPPPPALRGVGLALWGLRRASTVGREAERDAIWDALRRVHEERRARLVLIRGPSGVGKRQVVDAIAARAHELGAAHLLQVETSRDEVPGLALVRMAVGHLRTAHLWRPDVEDRVETWLDAHGGPDRELSAALTELLCPATRRDVAAGARVVRLETAAEHHTVLRRFLERLAADRPVILRIDEAEHAGDALDFVAGLLDAQGLHPSAVLVVLDASDDAVAEVSGAAARLERLAARPEATVVPVGPLAPHDHAALVRELLPLDPALARTVEERTTRTPLLAVQLVGDLVHRGALEAGPTGFRLRPGATVEVPDDVQASWLARVQRWLEGLDPEALNQLERAAILGRDVDRREWAEVGGREHRELRGAVLERVLEARAARRTDNGFVFLVDTLREALLRLARDGGRLEGHHAACARLAERLHADGVPDAAERLGRHLLGAGRAEEAVGPLLEGLRATSRRVGFGGALALLDLAQHAMTTAGVPPSDARWEQVGHERIQLLRLMGDMDGALDEVARWTHGWSAALAVTKAETHVMRHETALAWEAIAPALSDPRLETDEDLRGRALLCASYIVRRGPDSGAAMQHLEEALACYAGRNETQALHCRRAMSELALDRGHVDLAKRITLEIVPEYERLGSRFGLAECLVNLGEILRREGDLAGAEDAYRRAVALYEAMGSGQAALARINLGIARHARGDTAGARATFEAVLRRIAEKDRPALVGTTHALLLPVLAGLGDWADFDAHLLDAARLLASTGFADPDIVAALGEAAARAADGGHTDRARGVRALADAQLAALD